MIIGSNDNDAAKMALAAIMRERGRFFASAVRVMGETQNFVFGDATLDQIVFEEFYNTGIRTEASPTGNNDWGHTLPKKLHGTRGTVSVIIVISEDKQSVRVRCRIIHDPGFGGITHDGVPGPVQHGTQNRKKQKNEQVNNGAAALRSAPR